MLLKKIALFIVISILGFQYAFSQVDLSDFNKTESGMYYKFYVKNDNAPKAQSGDMITLTLVHRGEDDSVFYQSSDYPYPYTVSMMKSKKNSDFYEALEMMAEGDSATFAFDAEKYYMSTFGTTEMPPYIRKGSMMFFDIKIVDFKTKSEMAYEQMKTIEGQIKDEEDAIQEYLKKNNLDIKDSGSGLYYIETEKGSGEQPAEGNLVRVNYTARLLKTDKIVESTKNNGAQKEITLSPRYVMPGLIKGICMMKEGGTATLIIPSHLAYGASGSQNVPPNSPLIFEVELVKVYK